MSEPHSSPQEGSVTNGQDISENLNEQPVNAAAGTAHRFTGLIVGSDDVVHIVLKCYQYVNNVQFVPRVMPQSAVLTRVG